ncbi:MAG: FecR family protein [Thiotrichales bacterium]|nr:FecR family protein [Thiotrichales bacterium]
MLLAAFVACTPWASANQPIGTTVFARGAVTASVENDIRLIGHGTPIYERDVLTTGQDSFAIVRLDDGTEMSLRPNTVFRIDEYVIRRGRESVQFNLFKGGLRTVTGEAVERRPEAFELVTPVATIELLGTDFSARLCEDDCVEESSKLGDEAGGGPDVVGRVAFVKGEATAVSLFDKRRPLAAGGPVFQGDTLETGTGAFAVIAFRDESRITLVENTRFRISRHEYDAEAPERSSALMRLLRGGIRAVAGLISRARPESYEIATPVATISTRGTRFDIVCVGVCAQEGHSSLAPPTLGERALAALVEGLVRSAHAQGADGLFVVVRFGVVATKSRAGTFEFGAGTTAFIRSPDSVPRTDVPIPPAAQSFLEQAPVPEEVEVQPDLLQDSSRAVEEGDLAVAVYDGGVTATSTADTDTSIELREGDAGLLGSGEPVRLATGTPAFVTEDPYNLSPDVEVGDDGTVEGDLPPPAEEDSMSCRM